MSKMTKALIVTGGKISIRFLEKTFLNTTFDYIIASDKGLESLVKCNIEPNYIIGDFDSVDKEVLNKQIKNRKIKIIKLNPEKDYTDTHAAIKLAIKLKSTDITIIGGIGTRLDHTIANIHTLKEAIDNNIECKILNEKNEIRLITKKLVIKKDSKYKYISLIPLTTKVEGVSLKGFKYSLSNDVLSIGESLGISNEQTVDKASIEIKKGILILVRTKD